MCDNICRLCNRLILSDSITFDDTTNSLIIDIPAGTYYRGEKYCIVLAQPIPDTTTITALAYISIGGVTTTLYPLIRCNCSQVTACSLRTRTRYSTIVVTDSASGSFKLLGNVGCSNVSNLPSLPIATETTTTPATTGEIVVPIRKTATKKEVFTNE